MKYILGTDTLIYFLKGNEKVILHMSKMPMTHLFTTIINHAELLFGAFNSIKKKENIEKIQKFFTTIKILPFCEESSVIFAENKAKLKQEGNIIADLDLMIASITIKHKMTLITNNTRHFNRMNKLNIENWNIK